MKSPLLPLALLLSASSSAAQEAAPAGPIGTRLLDLDGDGALDLLALHADGSLAVRRNVGPRSFQDVVQDLPRVAVTDVLCSDLDGDGRMDLYLVSPQADVALLGLGGGRFREATAELGLGESGCGLSAERLDVDADGLPDLVLHNQGSDVLFWARADGRFERETRTADGLLPGPGSLPVVVLPASDRTDPGTDGPSANASGRASGGRQPVTSGSASTSTPALVAAPAAGTSSQPLMPINFDARYVNDDQGEVDSADIADGSLTGADVSTSSGDVTFGGNATVRATRGLFGQNSVSGSSSATVSGGSFNSALDSFATVSGGRENSAQVPEATISGGSQNTASGVGSSISGGFANFAGETGSAISGGSENTATGYYSTVSGGANNAATGDASTVSGGLGNTAAGDYSFAAGRRAKANHPGSFVWSDSSDVDKPSSGNDEFNVYAEGGLRVFTVGQTTPTLAVDTAGNVALGTASSVSGSGATVSGGDGNTILGTGTGNTIGGGKSNTVSGNGYSVVAGGFNNTATRGFTASYAGATVGGGRSNQATNIATTVGGGEANVASGYNATVPGGSFSTASGNNSFAAGRRAKATHGGSFVWGDGNNVDKPSSADNQFNVYASGGTRIFSNSTATTGVTLAPGAGTWSMVSDRNAKENVEAVDGREVLERVMALPISTWNYRAQDDAVRHMGPMAQDFWAAFQLGMGETSIDTIDPGGVALAAIQGLHELLAEQREANEAQAREIAGLRAELRELRESSGDPAGD